MIEACAHSNWEAAELLVQHGVHVNNADKQVKAHNMQTCCATLLCKIGFKLENEASGT